MPARSLVFFTSASVLVLEILAGRLMAPYVGVSLETFTGIIGTILAGIALGSALGGRLADRFPPRELLGPALVVGGVLSALSIPTVALLGPGLRPEPVSIVILASAGFFLPAMVLSTVGPVVTKLTLGSLSETGTVVGSLSAAGTAGALVGTFITGFVLVAAIPTKPIILGVSAVLVAVGFALWFRLGVIKPGPVVAVVVLASFGVAASSSTPCQVETAYACIEVVPDPERPSGRSLYLDGLRHSYIDLDDPTFLEFRYFRMFADVTASLSEGPIEALHIGGAGFAFPRYLATSRPGTNSLVLEIDDALVEVAQDKLGLELDDSLQVRIGDARVALDGLATDRFDLVVADAFSGRSVPWHLTTTEVMAELARMMTPAGVLTMNVIDGGANRFARAELATMGEHFAYLAYIEPPPTAVGRAQNIVLIASNEPLGAIVVDPADGTLIVGNEVQDFIDDAKILTDDFAPADQLTQDF